MPANGLNSLLWFIAIVAMSPVALWLLKRTSMGGGGASGSLRSIAALPLSASQRIVIVEVGEGDARRWLVLGVTAQSITTLHTMAPPADGPAPTQDDATPDAPPNPPGFAQLLDRLRRGPTDGR